MILKAIFALIISAAVAFVACPFSAHAEPPPPAPQGKKDLVTQWTCSGRVDCGDVSCDYKNKPASDPGGDVRRAVLRLIYACADERGVEPSTCRNSGIKCRPATGSAPNVSAD